MSALRHIFVLCCYAGLAAAAIVYGPQMRVTQPWLDQGTAIGLGVLIFFGGGLLHEVYARLGRENFYGEQMLALRYGHADLQDELNWMRREMEAMREALEVVTQSGHPGAGAEVVAEIKVLKGLLSRLSGFKGKTASASGPSGAPGPLTLVSVDDGNTVPGPGTLPPVAENLDEAAVIDVVRESMRDDRIDLVLQPIVTLPARNRQYYESFSRLRTSDGFMILPEQYIGVAEREGLITAIDNMLLFRCVQLVRKIQRKRENIGFFCNISLHTLADEDFFTDFVEFLESNRELAPNMIFEFTQSDFSRRESTEIGQLERLAMLGCRFSLDQVHDLSLDFNDLTRPRVSFVKISAEMLVANTAAAANLLRSLKDRSIDLIVEKVEDEETLIELLECKPDFGQGYLFGAPRLARPAA